MTRWGRPRCPDLLNLLLAEHLTGTRPRFFKLLASASSGRWDRRMSGGEWSVGQTWGSAGLQSRAGPEGVAETHAFPPLGVRPMRVVIQLKDKQSRKRLVSIRLSLVVPRAQRCLNIRKCSDEALVRSTDGTKQQPGPGTVLGAEGLQTEEPVSVGF